MVRHLRAWPKLIATLTAGVGLSGIVGGWTYSIGPNGHSMNCSWPMMAVAVALVALSYPLATGREWARRVLVLAVPLIGAFFAFFHIIALFEYPGTYSHSTEEQSRLVSLYFLLQHVSSLLVLLSVVAFGILFLSHPDVRASFQRGPHDREHV